MRKFALLIFCITLVLASAAPVAAGNTKEKPFHAELHGYLLGFNTDPAVIADRCTDPSNTWAVTSFEGWGDVTRLGDSYAYAEHCSYIEPAFTYGEGTLTLTGANGDVLLAVYGPGESIFLPEPLVGFTDGFTFTDGGTGRFAHASGGGWEHGSLNFDTGAFSLWMDGDIAYQK